MPIDLPFIWSRHHRLAVLAYVILDGFDLGVGIPSLLSGKAREGSDDEFVAPVWDGNETWLVLGGGGLLAVFPLAYSTILPALYAPIILMLLALSSGASPSNTAGARNGGAFVNWAFTGGSVVAAFFPGRGTRALVQAFLSPTAPIPAAGGTG